MAIIIKSKIENFNYRAGKTMKDIKLNEYELENFDINKASASGIINIDERNATRTVITLTRSPGSAFEAAAYSGTASTVSSRGFMMIQYLV